MSKLASLYRSILIVLVVLAVAGCGGAALPMTPGPVRVTLPEQAVARVIANEPRLTGIAPFDTGLVGQSSWYTVEQASGVGAFIVTVRVGWGDCEAGCINEHSWSFAVMPDGTVRVVNEAGPPVPADAWPGRARRWQDGHRRDGGCRTGLPRRDGAARSGLRGATGRRCRDRRARLGGSEVARVDTAADGSFFVGLPPGDYLLEPQAVEGLMGTAAAARGHRGRGSSFRGPARIRHRDPVSAAK